MATERELGPDDEITQEFLGEDAGGSTPWYDPQCRTISHRVAEFLALRWFPAFSARSVDLLALSSLSQ